MTRREGAPPGGIPSTTGGRPGDPAELGLGLGRLSLGAQDQPQGEAGFRVVGQIGQSPAQEALGVPQATGLRQFDAKVPVKRGKIPARALGVDPCLHAEIGDALPDAAALV